MTTVITIAIQKGGVGKTTTAINLAHGLALQGKQVLLIDLDPQAQAAVVLGIDQEPGVFNLIVAGKGMPPQWMRQWVRETRRQNLWLIPGNNSTSSAQTVINAEGRPISCIKEAIKPLCGGGLDYIIFDTAPSVGGIQERAIWAADLLIVPCATEYLSLDGAKNMVELLRGLSQKEWKGALLGLLPTMYDEHTNESRSSMEDLHRIFGDRLLQPIHRATVLRECPAEAATIFEKEPNGRSAAEYTALVDMVLRST